MITKNVKIFGIILIFVLLTASNATAGLTEALNNGSFEDGSTGDADYWLGDDNRQYNCNYARTGCHFIKDLNNGDSFYQTVSIDSDDAEFARIYFRGGDMTLKIHYQSATQTQDCNWDDSGWDGCLITSFNNNDEIKKFEVISDEDGTDFDDAELIYDDGGGGPI